MADRRAEKLLTAAEDVLLLEERMEDGGAVNVSDMSRTLSRLRRAILALRPSSIVERRKLTRQAGRRRG